MDIGKKIKELRTSKNLTLEELADRSELTKGFLSQLERNLTSPSIATLDDILEALGTNLADFFREDESERIVFGEEDFYRKESEGIVINWIVPNAQKNDMEPLLLEMEPNAKSQVVMPHDGEEFGYVLEGCIKLIDGGNEYIVKEKECFSLPGRHKHYLMNIHEEKSVVMWIMTPPNF